MKLGATGYTNCPKHGDVVEAIGESCWKCADESVGRLLRVVAVIAIVGLVAVCVLAWMGR